MSLTDETIESPAFPCEAGYHANETHVSRSMLAVAHDSWRTYEGMYVTRTCKPEPDSLAKDFGSFTHQQVLEPHLESLVIQIPKDKLSNGARRGKVWQEYESANSGKVLFKKDEYDDAMGCINALRKNLSAYLFNSIAEREVEIYWEHFTGLKLRAKLDLLLKGRHWVILDIKTAADVDRFPGEIRNRNLWLQAAHYRAAVKAEFGQDAIFRFPVVEKSGVYRVRHYELEYEALQEADERYEALLLDLAGRYESGDWSEESEKEAAVRVNKNQCFKRVYED